jgi:hypothetical protein
MGHDDLISTNKLSEVILIPLEEAVSIHSSNCLEQVWVGSPVLHYLDSHGRDSLLDLRGPLIDHFINAEVVLVNN